MSTTVDLLSSRWKLRFHDCTYACFRFGWKVFRPFPFWTGIGYVGAAGSGRAGSEASRNQTDPGAPKMAGNVSGVTVSEELRPWLPPALANRLKYN